MTPAVPTRERERISLRARIILSNIPKLKPSVSHEEKALLSTTHQHGRHKQRNVVEMQVTTSTPREFPWAHVDWYYYYSSSVIAQSLSEAHQSAPKGTRLRSTCKNIAAMGMSARRRSWKNGRAYSCDAIICMDIAIKHVFDHACMVGWWLARLRCCPPRGSPRTLAVGPRKPCPSAHNHRRWSS